MGRPNIICKHRISIVCEGAEEEFYIRKLISKDLWTDYAFRIVNAKGAGNVTACYQNEVNADLSEAVLIFCDTDRKPHDEYVKIKRKLYDILGDDADLKAFLIFANPCSMQIILLHFGESAISLATQSKHVNAKIIEKLTGISGYKAHQETQIKAICDKINRQNYELMKARAAMLPQSEDTPGSSNFHLFLQYFEQSDVAWIAPIKTLFEH